MSIVMFFAIGFLVKIDNKGVDESMLSLFVGWISVLVAGQEDLGVLPSLAFSLATWVVVAATVGWFLQSVVVILLSRRYEKPNPSTS